LIFFDKKESGLARIEGCDIVDTFPAIREDIRKIAFGCYLVELVDETTAEREANPDLFNMLKTFLSLLSDDEAEAQILRIFEIRLRGGLLCQRCSQGYHDLPAISPGTAKILQAAMEMDLSKIRRLKFSKQALWESETILSKFIQYHINKELKSKKFLKDLGM